MTCLRSFGIFITIWVLFKYKCFGQTILNEKDEMSVPNKGVGKVRSDIQQKLFLKRV